MRYVRWLGAYRRGASSLEEAARWETSGCDREVAAEPLVRGRSLVLEEHGGVHIGLEVDVEASRFVAGFYSDCWSEADQQSGRLVAASNPDERREWAFAKKLTKARSLPHHAEAWFGRPQYAAVIVRAAAPKRVRKRATALAAELGLPLRKYT